jgi:hypothetical protein
MNSIKSNPFLSALAGITIVFCGALFYLASQGGGKYDEAKASFDESYGAVSASEGIPLYPTAANRDGKRKALGEYRQAIGDLRSLFDKFRPGELPNVDPQEFTSRLKKANEDLTAAFKAAGSELPDGFFLGFEEYSIRLAPNEATGILGYQLDGISNALLGLADARPSRLIKVHREPIPEETGGTYESKPGDVARNFACEITFKGSESSARKFITHLGETGSHYYVIRCLKIINERDTPPNVEDAKFETAAPTAAAAPADIFKDVFILPGGEAEPEAPAPTAEDAAAGEEAAAGGEQPAAPAEEVDTTRILAQVLGSEDVTVFVRFDISMFLPVQELPNP